MLLFAILSFGLLTLWVPGRWALSLFQVALFGLAAVRLAGALWSGRRVEFSSTTWLLALVPLWGLVQVGFSWSVDSFRTLDEVLTWMANLAAFALACEMAVDEGKRSWFLKGMLALGTGISVLALLTMFSSPAGTIFWWMDVGTGLPTFASFVYRNQYAAFMESLLPVALVWGLARGGGGWSGDWFGLGRSSLAPWTFVFVAAVLVASVVAAGSRTGSILCLTEVLVVPLLAWGRGLVDRRTLLRIFLGTAMALVLLVGVTGWQFLWTRMQEPNPYGLRANLVRSSLEMVRARPWTGFGLGTWSTAYPGFAFFDDGRFVNQAHSDWAQWAVEGGIPLFILMLVVFWRVLALALRSVWGVGILTVFVHCLVDYPLQQRPALSAYFFAVWGIVATYRGARTDALKSS